MSYTSSFCPLFPPFPSSWTLPLCLVELILHHLQNLISSLFSEYSFLLLAQKPGFAPGHFFLRSLLTWWLFFLLQSSNNWVLMWDMCPSIWLLLSHHSSSYSLKILVLSLMSSCALHCCCNALTLSHSHSFLEDFSSWLTATFSSFL